MWLVVTSLVIAFFIATAYHFQSKREFHAMQTRFKQTLADALTLPREDLVMKQYDFKAALDHFENNDWDDEDVNDTIRFALAFTERAMGEPSDEMINVGYELVCEQLECGHLGEIENVFKAMRDQLIKEVEENDRY